MSIDLIQSFKDKARQNPQRIVFPEGDDERILKAAAVVQQEGIAKSIVLGQPDGVQAAADAAGVALDELTVINPKESPDLERYAAAYCGRRPNISPGAAQRLVRKVLAYGGMMVAENDADGMVCGAAHATASVIQAASLTVGLAPGIASPSSFFIMILPEFAGEANKIFIFADAALAIDPTAEELAGIAIATARNAQALLGMDPKVALLSFSTKGSGAHASVDKVLDALRIARETDPGLQIDGELQADSAISPKVAKRKVKESSVAGEANVLVFPDLNSANIAYKLVQYMGKALAIGPVMQGFRKPVNDLSRGATVDDIVSVAAIAVVQAQSTK